MLRYVRILFLLIGLVPAVLLGKGIEAVVGHTYYFAPDPQHAGMRIPYIELYWQVNHHTLHYFTDSDKNIIGRFQVSIQLYNDTGIFKTDQFYYQTVPKKDVRGLNSLNIIDQRKYFISYGATKIVLKLIDDADSLSTYSYSDTFSVKMPVRAPFLSEPQLIDTFMNLEFNTPFSKDGKQKIPHCTNFLDDKNNVLHYYTECYNMDQIPAIEYPLTLNVFISQKATGLPFGAPYLKVDSVENMAHMESVGTFTIDGLFSGNYYLVSTIENKLHQVIATNNYFFQRLNSHPKFDTAKRDFFADTSMEKVNVLDLNKTFLKKYDLGQIKAILKMMLPVCDPLETNTVKGFLKNPDEMYMRYFIYNFFSARNSKDPGVAWKEYSEKVIEANKRFSYKSTLGYETDRGFVFLRYGEPSEIVPVENENGARPYHIWQYNSIQQKDKKDITNGVFLFYRSTDLSDLRLLHTTVDGEVQNLLWRSFLYTNSEGSDSFTSRAEQYLGKH